MPFPGMAAAINDDLERQQNKEQVGIGSSNSSFVDSIDHPAHHRNEKDATAFRVEFLPNDPENPMVLQTFSLTLKDRPEALLGR